jgi:uncharacterized membrane protein
MNLEMEQPTSDTVRLWEVDLVRGIAVVLMIFYHFVFDLAYFDVYAVDMYRGPWQIFARSIGTTFIVVMGVSLTLRYNRLRSGLGQGQLFRKHLVRGATLVGWGLVITVVTYFVVGRGFVIFGILHLLGLSTILAFPFLRSRWASLAGGLLVIGVGLYAGRVVSTDPWLVWLGVQQFGRFMVDWYPVFPWFGAALVGAFVGFTLWPGGRRRFQLPDLSRAAPVRGLTFLGRHSLPIYLIHQPVLFGILIVTGIGSI